MPNLGGMTAVLALALNFRSVFPSANVDDDPSFLLQHGEFASTGRHGSAQYASEGNMQAQTRRSQAQTQTGALAQARARTRAQIQSQSAPLGAGNMMSLVNAVMLKNDLDKSMKSSGKDPTSSPLLRTLSEVSNLLGMLHENHAAKKTAAEALKSFDEPQQKTSLLELDPEYDAPDPTVDDVPLQADPRTTAAAEQVLAPTVDVEPKMLQDVSLLHVEAQNEEDEEIVMTPAEALKMFSADKVRAEMAPLLEKPPPNVPTTASEMQQDQVGHDASLLHVDAQVAETADTSSMAKAETTAELEAMYKAEEEEALRQQAEEAAALERAEEQESLRKQTEETEPLKKLASPVALLTPQEPVVEVATPTLAVKRGIIDDEVRRRNMERLKPSAPSLPPPIPVLSRRNGRQATLQRSLFQR